MSIISIPDHIQDHARMGVNSPDFTLIANNNIELSDIRSAPGLVTAYYALGAYSKVASDAIVSDKLGAANIDATKANITAVTSGTTTFVTLSANPWGLVPGGLLTIDAINGTDGSYISGQTFSILSITGLQFELRVDTTGKALTGPGTVGNGEFGTIKVPSGVEFVNVTGHLTYPDQNVGAGHASLHLWRALKSAKLTQAAIDGGWYAQAPFFNWLDAGHRPTPECHYHNRAYYPQLTSSFYISVLATSGWVPVLAENEIWSIFGWQDSGATVKVASYSESWISVQYR